jgi:hypothetical protein
MDLDALAKEIEKVITDLRRILDRIEDEKKEELYGIGTASKENEKNIQG